MGYAQASISWVPVVPGEAPFEHLLHLNVSGTIFTVMPSVLAANSGYFEGLKEEEGDEWPRHYFIGRSAVLFAPLLEFMNSGRLSTNLNMAERVGSLPSSPDFVAG